MSHELRTPLNAILGFAQLLQRDVDLPPSHRQHLDTIHRSGEHLLELINDVLAMSKIEAGRTTLNVSSFDLHQLLETLESMVGLRAEQKGLQLRFECEATVPQYIRSDEGKLRQVLINLLSNAVKFTDQGRVVVRVGRLPQESTVGEAAPHDDGACTKTGLFFEVEDTGVGIAPEEMALIFEPFSQAESGRRAKEGTGLGLSICRRFVELMGGTLTVRSTVGEGSVFRFEVCVEEAIPDETSSRLLRRRVVGLASGQPTYRILVVEDERINRHLLVQVLTPLGFEVREATNGQEGLAVWEAWSPHVILMDMRMPVLNGYEATQRIKATTKGQATVVIALTASVFEEDRAMVLSAGCDGLMHKPIREAELFEALAEHLGVRYVYESQAPPSFRPGEEREEASSSAALTDLPPAWIGAMHQAALAADDKKIRALIGALEADRRTLADALERWTHDFRFDRIVALTEAARQDWMPD